MLERLEREGGAQIGGEGEDGGVDRRVGEQLSGICGPARDVELGGGLLGDVGADITDGDGAGGGKLGEGAEVILRDDAAADDRDVMGGLC